MENFSFPISNFGFGIGIGFPMQCNTYAAQVTTERQGKAVSSWLYFVPVWTMMSLKHVLGTGGRILPAQLGRCLSSAVKYAKYGDPTAVLK